MPDIISLKMLGVAGLLSYAAARLAAKAGMLGYNRLMLVAVPVSGMPQMPRGFRVEALCPHRLRAHAIDVSPDVQSLRFAQGMTCLGAFNSKDDLIGVTWVGSGPFEEDSMAIRFHVPVEAGWDTGLWIKPQYRLGRGFAALWAGTAEWLRANGKSWSMSWIADYNLPSLLSHRRMGAMKVGQIMTLRLFHWQYMAEGQPRLIRMDGEKRTKIAVPLPPVHLTFMKEMS